MSAHKTAAVPAEPAMTRYMLSIVADSGYASTTEGRCNAEQYGRAMAALHGAFPQATPAATAEEIKAHADALFAADVDYFDIDQWFERGVRWAESRAAIARAEAAA